MLGEEPLRGMYLLDALLFVEAILLQEIALSACCYEPILAEDAFLDLLCEFDCINAVLTFYDLL